MESFVCELWNLVGVVLFISIGVVFFLPFFAVVAGIIIKLHELIKGVYNEKARLS